MKTNWGTGIDMTPSARCSIIIALAISITLPAWGQNYYLYTPQPATPALKSLASEGILVQEMEVQKGDTLYAISRKFSGRGMYFPQILLFNDIKNPNLIYPGALIRVPVSHKESTGNAAPDTRPKGTSSNPRKTAGKSQTASSGQQTETTAPASSTELSLSDLKKVGTSKSAARQNRKVATTIIQKKPIETRVENMEPSPPSPVTEEAMTGQKLFEAAVKAYRKDDCRTAIELLDRYLTDNMSSALAADATLYKADCFLKFSAQ